MDPSSSDWVWYPDQGAYYSARSQAYARPGPNGWEYFPIDTSAVGQTQVQPGSTIPGDENRRTRVDYSDLEQDKSKDVDKEPQGTTQEEEGGGIGNVGWGLDFVLPGEEPPNIPQKGVRSVNGDTTGKAASTSDDIAGPSGPTVNPKSIPGTSNAVPTKHASTLRLVKIESPSTSSSTTSPSSSSPLATTETLAILDARPSGYILGRDKHLSLPVLRLKELAVSKIHAAVWFWIVDCGSTHGTFLQNSTDGAKGDPHRLSPARTPSSPFPLKHLDRLTIGSTTFECHLHPDWPCEHCALNDPSSVIPLTDPEESVKATTYTSAGTAAAGSGLSASAAGIPTVPGNWKETEERRIALTAEAKRADTHRRSALAMKKLRESYFGGSGGGGGTSSGGEEKTGAATGGKRKWEHKRESDEGWKKKRGGDAA
ncbi:hypothetical protein HD553DRAFT_294176 [Filobasidium floriforme]|uniref:uncharacterized protein n=1 Tax=Filobasidium floriforme TaxID=5210 RepID=UPI001E8E351D|nr:uncharacterized protein HD553DRAFT_294176 [Filobasidium floriforme]KAH8087512.1 hypothetical protein HD553DRAFT_294176 [Filobasidium floriforme]